MNIYNSHIAKLIAKSRGREYQAFGITCLPETTFFNCPREQVSEGLQRHEDKHKAQWRRYWYIGFPFVYLYQLKRYGYEKMPLEVEARI